MEIQVEFPMDRPLFVRIVWAQLRRTFVTLWCFSVFILGLAVLGAYTGDPGFWQLLLILGLILAVLPPLTMVLSIRRLSAIPAAPWRYRYAPDGISETTPIVSSTRPWSAVKDIRETPELWVLRFTPAGVMGLPKRYLTAEQTTTFRELVARSRPR